MQGQNYHLHNGIYLRLGVNRLYSYKHQVELTFEANPQTVLIVGKGDGLVETIISSSGIKVISVDIDRLLKPSIVASVESIPTVDNCVDLCICCEVLEHLNFDLFEKTLREIYRVAKYYLILSLPDVRRFFSFRLIAPKINITYQASLPHLRKEKFPRSRTESMGHYWEIGYKGYEFDKISNAIESAGWKIAKYFRVHDMYWHTFFYCTKGQ